MRSPLCSFLSQQPLSLLSLGLTGARPKLYDVLIRILLYEVLILDFRGRPIPVNSEFSQDFAEDERRKVDYGHFLRFTNHFSEDYSGCPLWSLSNHLDEFD